MSKRIVAVVCGVVLMLAASVDASAQMQWNDVVFINVNGGVQTGTKTFDTTFASTVYEEAFTVDTTQELKGGGLFDITGGGKIRGNFGAALSFTARSSKSDATAVASVPDPIFFDQFRTVTSTIADLEHSEKWVGILGVWFVPVGEKLDLMLMGGPAVASVTHETPTTATVTETGGAPTVTLGIESLSKSFWGYHIGADLRYMITTNLGVGGFARFNGASGNRTDDNELSLGGFQIGGGLRIRF